jgi:dihydroorotate dehydrogenase electron transfer subunit
MNYPEIIKIDKVIKETKDVKTFLFEYPEKTIPGQFFMIWIPGIDEIPMGVSYVNDIIKGITFKKVGEATNSLFGFKKGDKIGIRGPLGNGFRINGKNILFIGGGTGIAMIAPAVEEAIIKKLSVTVILGAKNKDELFFEKRIKSIGANILISTEDGSKGFNGLATQLTRKILNDNKFDMILTCGPEIMMKKIFDISEEIPFQASLERYIKCGIGICGQCCIGKGLRVCKDGPIFDKKALKNVEDFGVFRRDSSGKKINFYKS